MTLEQIIAQDEDARDSKWELQFLTALSQGAKVSVLSEKPILGPDGMPYLLVDLSEAPEASSLENVLHWLCDNGIGLVINPQKSVPDYVFPYGMLWYWKQTGKFLEPTEAKLGGAVQFKNGEQIVVGQPSEEYLPAYVRSILKEFFAGLGVTSPRVLLIGKTDNQAAAEPTAATNFDLCFSLESLGHPPAMEHKNILERIAWFFPQHYPLLLISEKGLPEFIAL